MDKAIYLLCYVIPTAIMMLVILLGAFALHWLLGLLVSVVWVWVWLHFYTEWVRELRRPTGSRS